MIKRVDLLRLIVDKAELYKFNLEMWWRICFHSKMDKKKAMDYLARGINYRLLLVDHFFLLCFVRYLVKEKSFTLSNMINVGIDEKLNEAKEGNGSSAMEFIRDRFIYTIVMQEDLFLPFKLLLKEELKDIIKTEDKNESRPH